MSSVNYQNLVKNKATLEDLERSVELETYLNMTDYIPIKIYEAKLCNKDIYSMYKDKLNEREKWRNELDTILKKYNL